MTPITQAVIIAGGQGTRLRPLTNTIPKPMILFHGKPFLEYLIEQIKEQGCSRILLLLGYLPQAIQDYFGDGKRFGVEIDYSVTDVANDTGRRMKLAESQMDPLFLFMYCDNYVPVYLPDMYEHFVASGAHAQLTIYSNKDHYSRDNVRVDELGMIVAYDKNRSLPNLQGVELGYAIMKKEILALLPDDNISFEARVYPELARRKKLSAYVTDHRYYSVSTPERLPITERFLERQPTVILDRDGVLNEKPPKAEYVTEWSRFKWLPGVKKAIRLLHEAGYQIIIVTNQAGIARGKITKEDLEDIHQRMKAEIIQSGGKVDAIYYCPHGWDEGCECRKPKPGMLFTAQKDFCLDLTRTFFIGDDERDQQTRRAAGCKTILVDSTRSLLDVVSALS